MELLYNTTMDTTQHTPNFRSETQKTAYENAIKDGYKYSLQYDMCGTIHVNRHVKHEGLYRTINHYSTLVITGEGKITESGYSA